MIRLVTALVAAAAWLQHTAIGPVILSITPEHGMHAGDVLAAYPVVVALAVSTVNKRSCPPQVGAGNVSAHT